MRAQSVNGGRQVEYIAVAPTRAPTSIADDARRGLRFAPRSLPPKYFYDARGAELFERICRLPEYYLTRVECALLDRHMPSIITACRPGRLLELGSGSPHKAQYLLDACEASGLQPAYLPFDICADSLISGADLLRNRYPWLEIEPLLGDYTCGVAHLPRVLAPTLFLFLGSSIGNFIPDDATTLLAELRAVMGTDDRLLIGVDRVKDPQRLHAAYNDSAGVTAEFNLNVLNVLNRELNAHFDSTKFAHYAMYNAAATRMEMYLIATESHRVEVGALGMLLEFAEGEPILTEVSCKYTLPEFNRVLHAAGFRIERHMSNDDNGYSLALCAPQ